MSAVRSLANQNQESVRLAEAKAKLHSFHSDLRHQAVNDLAQLKDPEASRELIHIFHDCEWRATKFLAIDGLTKNPTQRGIEFLFRLALSDKDLALSQAAIQALGKTHKNLAARFLHQTYLAGPAVLKPFCVSAIAQIPSRSLVKEFLADLPRALASGETLLAKNYILALGELKVFEATPLLFEIAEKKQLHASLSLMAVVSLGKLCRDFQKLEPLEKLFIQDAYEHQVFQASLNQIITRGQWQLEDYLQKYFDPQINCHPNLPFELNNFKPDDVLEGIKLFVDHVPQAKVLALLSKLDFDGLAPFYEELVNVDAVTPEELIAALDSCASHYRADFEAFLEKTKPRALSQVKTPIFDRWLEALTLCLPKADKQIHQLLEKSFFESIPDEQRIRVINHSVNFGLTILTDEKRLQGLAKSFDHVLEFSQSRAVQSRIMRAFAQLGVTTKLASSFVKEKISDQLLQPSILYFMEMCPEKQNHLLLAKLLVEIKTKSSVAPNALKAFQALEDLSHQNSDLDQFVKLCLSPDSPEETQRQALRLLIRCPLEQSRAGVLKILKIGTAPQLQLLSLIALKTFAKDEDADHVAEFLRSPEDSLRGRALDTLTALPGNRAKRLIVDHLNAHPTDLEACEKIARSLTPPEGDSDYFVKAIKQFIEKHPTHSFIEEIRQLQGRCSEAKSEKRAIVGDDVKALDIEISKRLKHYAQYDEAIKSALRSAEFPFHKPKMFDHAVDKSSSVLGYCKALDMILEKYLGRKHLYPKLETQLHEFQNLIHLLELAEQRPSNQRVLESLQLQDHFSPQSLPLHKMQLMAQGVLNSKIVNEHFKIIDGLRAWAVALLLFSRSKPKKLVPLGDLTDEKIIEIAKNLMDLQDLRNPVAHRETMVDFKLLDQIRTKVFSLLTTFEYYLF